MEGIAGSDSSIVSFFLRVCVCFKRYTVDEVPFLAEFLGFTGF